jgi:membrane protein required for colicin V production
MIDAIGWVDWAMLAVLVLSIVVGALRGLVFEVLAIVGWIVAYFVAQWAAPLLAPHLPIGRPGSLLNQGVAFASAFIATLIVWGLLSRLLRRLIHATPLHAADRVLGAAFGLARGCIVLLAVAVVVAYTPAAKSPEWRASIGAAWLNSALQGLKPLLPAYVSNLLRI